MASCRGVVLNARHDSAFSTGKFNGKAVLLRSGRWGQRPYEFNYKYCEYTDKLLFIKVPF